MIVNNHNCLAAAAAAAAKSLQSSPTLCDPIDGSPPGSSVHGIFQARTLEWVAIHCLLCITVLRESKYKTGLPRTQSASYSLGGARCEQGEEGKFAGK